jgi:hypothetical protein
MLEKKLWERWVDDWNWIMTIAGKRNWLTRSFEIKPPVDITEVILLEENLGVRYPEEFKFVLTNYSSNVNLFWQMGDEEPEKEFRGVFSGGEKGGLWDFSSLQYYYEGYTNWIKECFSNPDDDYDRVWHNKVPFLDVATGDIIAFDTSKSLTNSPVIYLSHDGSNFHGHRLGENFIDFITKWSNLGCVGTEDWQFEAFYNYEKMELLTDDPKIDRWKSWLNK